MSELTLEVHRREDTGKNANRRLRAAGQVPAVLYGGGKEPVSIQIQRRALLDLLRHGSGENTIFLLKLAGGDSQRHAMIREIETDPVTNQVLHLDFQRVEMSKKLRVEVPIELTGTAYGVKTEGGVLDFVTREVEVECLPADIPAHLTFDVTGLHIGDHVEASALTLPKGVELVTEGDRVIASVSHVRVETATEAAGEGLIEGAAKEPEVVSRGKKEEK